MKREYLYGRLVTLPLLYRKADLPADVIILPAIKDNVCSRCHTKIKQQWQLPNRRLYCWGCAELGRLDSLQTLITIPEPGEFTPPSKFFQWSGELTKQQQQVSEQLIAASKQCQSILIQAVTGAGKTEMMFPFLKMLLTAGKRVAWVAPRIDVIRELAPRLKNAFALPIAVLHGEQEEPYQYTQFVLATAHQLLRFRTAFDVIILDEADAFPFRDNHKLQYALKAARQPDGVLVFLTATPNEALNRLCTTRLFLPRRFHGGLLPRIKIYRARNWRKQLPRRLVKYLRQLGAEQQLLVFVPEIEDVLPQVDLIERLITKVAGASSKTVERAELVDKFRKGELQVLVTTTILERGVTIPKIDVMILGADEDVFNTEALLQMAGRVGRSSEVPTGLVWAFVAEMKWNLYQVNHEIKGLNYFAQKIM